MPTGYTHQVVEGTVDDFPTFAKTCARAFGALITLRDDPLSAELPDAIEPSDHHEKALVGAKAELARLEAMTAEEAEVAADAHYREAVESFNRMSAKDTEENARINAMLEKVQAWTPPTKDHEEMKRFMTEQLHISLNNFRRDPPRRQPASEWLSSQTKKARWNVDYHQEEHTKEIERCRQRTEWIQALKRSLA
jgi:hypothetical protein